MAITPDIDSRIGARFKIIREHLKLNQIEMAELCGIKQGMVSMIEKGKRDIPFAVVRRLYLDRKISPLYLVAGIGTIEYGGKEESNLEEIRADIEILKAKLM